MVLWVILFTLLQRDLVTSLNLWNIVHGLYAPYYIRIWTWLYTTFNRIYSLHLLGPRTEYEQLSNKVDFGEFFFRIYSIKQYNVKRGYVAVGVATHKMRIFTL